MRRSSKQVVAGLLCAAGWIAAGAREPNEGDLVAGFTEQPAAGAPISVEIDIGQAALYMDALPGIYPVANLSADLKQAFGLWLSQRTIGFGVVGTSGGDVWATSAEPSGSPQGTAAPAYLGAGLDSYLAAVSTIDVLYGTTNAVGAFGGGNTRTLGDIPGQPNPLTSNPADSLSGIFSLAGLEGSFSAERNAGGEGFAIPTSPDVGFAAAVNLGFQTASADLYELLPSTALGSDQPHFGYFTLDSEGLLTYTVIPEPAATSMVIALGAILIASLRRRLAPAALS